jgi:membrane-associated protease RseP (regulator of RpoE activity)
MDNLLGILLFSWALMLAILFHEGGHFATSKLFGMKVERFFLGFGRTIWSTRRGETEYGIKALPLGGFCKIAGMSPYEHDGNFLDAESPRPRRQLAAAADAATDTAPAALAQPTTPAPDPTPVERMFYSKPAWQRAIVLAAGSITHFIVALLLIYGLLVAVGLQINTNRISEVVQTAPNGATAPAAAAGLRAGDRVVEVDGKAVHDLNELRSAFASTAGRSVRLVYERDGQRHETSIVPVPVRDDNQVRGFLGVRGSLEKRRFGPIAGAAESGRLFWQASVGSVKGLGQIIPGLADRLQPQGQGAPSSGGGGEGGGGPVGIIGIARFAGEAIAANQWVAFLLLLIQFNIFVGLFNLLPIPPMDGGYLAFLAWEKVTGRAVDLRKVAPVAVVIVGLLVMLTVGLVWLDITNPITMH